MSTATPLRVVSVDDDTATRLAMPHLLPMFTFAAPHSTVEALLAARPDVDVVLLDLKIDAPTPEPSLQGGAAVRAVKDAGYQVLIYTNERRRDVLAGCLSCGARGVAGKTEPLAAVEQAIRSVADGRIALTQSMIGLVELADRRGLIARLTPRQRQVLSARARGETFASIGNRFGISVRTVEDHWSEVTHKFADYLVDHSAADLERRLGIGFGDLLAESP